MQHYADIYLLQSHNTFFMFADRASRYIYLSN